ncbi:MAG: type II CRISPR-associated endonuclease Cas1 [Flavobacteriales bacterium]|nr:type II CRISPR-associated endonuclease Cas1 [Flavobacteriales bacterium]
MIKRTIHIGSPCTLRRREKQLVVQYPKDLGLPERTVPIEDISVVLLDHERVVVTQMLLAALLENNVAVITCNEQHMPTGLLLNLDGHTVQTELFRHQIEASEPLRKNLWMQTVQAKLRNQAALLEQVGIPGDSIREYARNVRSGDPDNMEARGAAHYWRHLFPSHLNFVRHRFGEPPNNLLNYGYAILRAVVARSLVGSGLLPTLGIHHRNKYNAYCLADDVMEPYRPFVDEMVLRMVVKDRVDPEELTTPIKGELLKVPTLDVLIDGKRSPLLVAVQRSTASLAQCFQGGQRKALYPEWPKTLNGPP